MRANFSFTITETNTRVLNEDAAAIRAISTKVSSEPYVLATKVIETIDSVRVIVALIVQNDTILKNVDSSFRTKSKFSI